MSVRVGIVGLPNVGKSTLFNAVSGTGVEAANYPFATIEPNVAVVAVPDERLAELTRLAGMPQEIPATVEFRDIAGLVKGASVGEGLGNQFLSHIRDVDAVVHIVRCFDDPDVTHVTGTVDAVSDAAIVDTELLLKDLETLERHAERVARVARANAPGGDRPAAAVRMLDALRSGQPARRVTVDDDTRSLARELGLLTAKPVLYVANVGEADLSSAGAETPAVKALRAFAAEGHAEVIVVSAKVEAEVAQLEPDDRQAFLTELGLERSGLDRLVVAAYRLLDLVTFFTIGPKEVRAWTIRDATKAPEAAGVIHSDMQRGFIRAEVMTYDDLAALGGEQEVRQAGRLRVEGKDYMVRDGDVLLVRFNV